MSTIFPPIAVFFHSFCFGFCDEHLYHESNATEHDGHIRYVEYSGPVNHRDEVYNVSEPYPVYEVAKRTA